MEGISTIILAAGKGTRMRSDLVKVLHPLLGLPMLSYPIGLSLNGIKAEKTIVVVGHQADRIQERFKDLKIEFALQQEQLGTGHAVLQAVPFLHSFSGTVLILCGDVPLVKLETLHSFIETYTENESTLSVLTAMVEDPFGYGRILRNPEGWLERIAEEKDASQEERMIREINTGIFCVRAPFLMEGLKQIGKENAQGEYYLTEVILSPLVKSSRSVPSPSSPVTSTSLRSQPVTVTDPAVFEISTVPAGSAAVSLLMGVPASAANGSAVASSAMTRASGRLQGVVNMTVFITASSSRSAPLAHSLAHSLARSRDCWSAG